MAKAPTRLRRDDSGPTQIGGAASNVVTLATTANPNDIRDKEDDIKAVLLGDLERSLESVQSEMGRHRNVIKRVMGKGIHVKAAKDVLAIKSAKQAEELLAYAVAVSDYMYITGQGWKKDQLDLLRHVESRQPGVERAAVEGHFSAMRGDGEGKNPYAVESKQGQAWITAFRNALSERTRILAAALAVGDETLIKGEQAGEAETVADAEADEDDIDGTEHTLHAEFDGDPGAELDAPDPDSELDEASL